MTVRILVGHVLARLRGLPAESVHCVVTSPPYYGLRDYGIEPQVWGGEAGCAHEWGEWREKRDVREEAIHGKTRTTDRFYGDESRRFDGNHQKITAGQFCCSCDAWRGSLGLEPTLALYLDHMVEVFREVRRVMRKDATCWLNIGDSYCAAQGGRQAAIGELPKDGKARFASNKAKAREDVDVTGWAHGVHGKRVTLPANSGLKPKDLMMIPARLAIRLQDDGWWVRSDIAWCKRAPMPESCTDRPTSAWEHVFLLTKSARYFYDAEAVKEDSVSESRSGAGFDQWNKKLIANSPMTGGTAPRKPWDDLGGKRNMRNVWLLGPEPFPEAHFATFPTEIPRRAILAGTSERGVCPKCSAPWERVVAKERRFESGSGRAGHMPTGKNGENLQGGGATLDIRRGPCVDVETLGWRPTCGCPWREDDAPDPACAPVPATVLDPFLGAGTTALVADRLGRDCIGVELNPEYAAMARRRIGVDAPLLAEVAD